MSIGGSKHVYYVRKYQNPDKHATQPLPRSIILFHVPFFRRTHLVLAVVLVDQDISVPRLAGLHVDDGVVGVLEGTLLDPGLDLLLGGEVEHVLDLLGRTDSATTDLDAVADEGEGVDVGQVAAVRGTGKIVSLLWFAQFGMSCDFC